MTQQQSELDWNNMKLEIVNEGSVCIDYPECKQPPHITLPLRSFQLQTINAMVNLENDECLISDNTYIKTAFGVLCNKTGSGKSFCILGLISLNQSLNIRESIVNVFSEQIAIMKKNTNKRILKCNLLVVPLHLIETVWVPYIRDCTTLKYNIIKGKEKLSFEVLDTVDIVICASKMYNQVIEESIDIYWSRVIFDESDSIVLPSCKKPNTIFTWFVTSSIKNLMFPSGTYWKHDTGVISRVINDGIKNNGWIKTTFKTLEKCTSKDILSKIFIKIADDYIDSIINIPKIEYITHYCKSPYFVHILNEIVVSPETLYANNYKLAMKESGIIYEDTINSLIDSVYKYLNKQLKNSMIKLNYLLSLETTEYDSHINDTKLSKVKAVINTLKSQIKSIDCKLRQLDVESIDDTCPICYDLLKQAEPCMLSCCKNFICYSCIAHCITKNIHNCCICRSQLKEENIIKFIKYNSPQIQLNKIDCVTTFILDNINNNQFRLLLFSTQEESLTELKCKLSALKITNVKQPTKLNTSILDLYNNGDIKVMLLNARQFACGINLISTSDIMFFHKMNLELTNQIIGRAQRIGRTTSLRVHTLLYESE